jgi:fatty acid desaturase
MRYRADIRTLCFVAIYFALVAYQFIYAPKQLWIAIPIFVLTCWFSFFGAVATHNTVHSPVFRNRTANRIFQCALTLTYGHPVSAYVPGHNLSHHKHTQTRRDIMRTHKARFRWNLLNGLLFMPSVAGSIFMADFRYYQAMHKRNPPWARQMTLEWIVLLAPMIALFVIDWKRALLYIVVPHQYAAWGIVTMNLLQHDGTDEKHEFNHSRNFVGKVVNWFTYNNGFHGIHHIEPGLHWSLTPQAHAERVAPFIHPNLDQKSLLSYLWKTYFWPGKRLNFDGTPVVLPEVGADEEWIPAPSETRDDLGAIA